MSDPVTPAVRTFVAVVHYDRDTSDIGAVFEEDGGLVSLWLDGHADPVTRDRSGHLIHDHGCRLPVVSRSRRCGEAIAAAFDAYDSHLYEAERVNSDREASR